MLPNITLQFNNSKNQSNMSSRFILEIKLIQQQKCFINKYLFPNQTQLSMFKKYFIQLQDDHKINKIFSKDNFI
ncbi:hypothetical protein pb186bvf_006844 [Paramecium bursaria]